MKKLISAVLFALSGISAPIFAQSDIKQMSFPKHIYIGDTAEIHYTFGSGVDFFPDEESIDEKNLLFSTLPFKSDIKAPKLDDYADSVVSLVHQKG